MGKRRPKGTGGICQRADGLWVASFEMEPHPDGRRRRKMMTARAREEAEAKLQAWLDDHPEAMRDRGVIPPESRVPRITGNALWNDPEIWAHLRSFNHTCYYCGGWAMHEIDHKIPLCRGGTNDIDNLVLTCRPCNTKKSWLTAEEFMARRAAG